MSLRRPLAQGQRPRDGVVGLHTETPKRHPVSTAVGCRIESEASLRFDARQNEKSIGRDAVLKQDVVHVSACRCEHHLCPRCCNVVVKNCPVHIRKAEGIRVRVSVVSCLFRQERYKTRSMVSIGDSPLSHDICFRHPGCICRRYTSQSHRSNRCLSQCKQTRKRSETR